MRAAQLSLLQRSQKTTKYSSPAPRYRNQTQLPRAPIRGARRMWIRPPSTEKNYAALFRKIPFKFRQNGEYT